MVEHNLAKVGVASSNLVSRSIFFFFSLIFPYLLNADSIYLDKTYCVEQDSLKASFFGYSSATDNPVLVEIPKDRMQYSITTNSILSFFADHNISVIDTSDGVIVFKRGCKMMGKLDEIESAFLMKFQALAPFVIIDEKPLISIKSSLPPDFKRYQLSGISISDSMLRRNSGSFVGIFQIGNKERKLYFSYEMNAKATVFKAKRNLLNGKILTIDDYDTTLVSLDALPTRAIVQEMPHNLVVKSNIKEGQIFTDYLFDVKRLVYKKESIKALFKEDGLSIEVQATLLEDADLGDIVKIKTEQGKVLSAKIISSKEAVIVE